MKKVIRSLLFVKHNFYSYPYTQRNLDKDLVKIANARYFDLQNDLRCKVINDNQFDIWEKWNFGIGTRSFFYMGNANAYFSGTTIKEGDSIIVEGLVFPNPLGTITTYLVVFALVATLFFIDYSDASFYSWKLTAILSIVVLASIITSLFFRKRIERKVMKTLDLTALI